MTPQQQLDEAMRMFEACVEAATTYSQNYGKLRGDFIDHPQSMVAPAGVPDGLVTLESALEAIDHVAHHNGPGRASEAKRMLSAAPASPQPAPAAVKESLTTEPTALEVQMLEFIKRTFAMANGCATTNFMHHTLSEIVRGAPAILAAFTAAYPGRVG